MKIEEAICLSNVPSIKRAVASGWNPNVIFTDGPAAGFTALTLALTDVSCGRHVRFEVVKLLIDSGANVNTRAENYGGTTPLHEAVRSLRLEAVEYLLSEGADVNAADSQGNTPIMVLSSDGSERPRLIVERLIAAGADLSRQANDGTTAYMRAKNLGREDVMEVIQDALGSGR